MEHRKKKMVGVVLLVLLFVAVTAAAVPVMRHMMLPEFQQELTQWVRGAGLWGVGLLLLIQMAQIVVAIIPGEPVEVVAGVMYGAVGGLLICLTGILISSAAVFWVVRKLGRERLRRTKLYPKLTQYAFLRKADRLQAMVFLLYLIPGTPKDMLVYVCALTDIPMRSFLTISTIARIPSIITSTMAGATFASGNYLLTVLIFVLTGLAGLLGIAYHNKRFGKSEEKPDTTN